MPRVSPIQDNFNGGQISERSQGRLSSDYYARSLDTCENFIPLVQGPMHTRNGSQLLSKVSGSNTDVRLETFTRGVNQDVIVEIGDNLVALQSKDGPVTDTPSNNIVPGADWSTGYANWTRDFGWSVWIPNFNNLSDPWAYPGFGTTYAMADWLNQRYSYSRLYQEITTTDTGNPHSIQTNVTVTRTTPVSVNPTTDYMTARLRVGTGPNDGTYLDRTVNFNLPSGSATRQIYFNESFTPPAANFTVTIQVTNDTGVQVAGDTDFYEAKWDPIDIRTNAGTGGTAVIFTSPYSLDQLPGIHIVMDAGEAEMWITHPNVEPRRLKRSVAGAWTFEALTTIGGYVAPPNTPWAGTVWPGAVAIHDSRLFLAGTDNNPAGLWGSRVDNYLDFNSSGANDKADPVFFPLSVAGRIQWLAGNKRLLIGTDLAEVVANPAGTPLAFDDFFFEEQSFWGSSPVQPVNVGRTTVFVQTDLRKVRVLADSGDRTNSWDSFELSLLASDIFNGKRVLRLHYSDTPEYQLFALLSSGDIAACTFDLNEQISGWWPYTTNGIIKSFTKENETFGEGIWLSTQRFNVDGPSSPENFLEFMSFKDSDQFALDMWSYDNIPATGISGAQFIQGILSAVNNAWQPLNGQTFRVMVQKFDDEGNVSFVPHPERTIGYESVTQTYGFAVDTSLVELGDRVVIGLSFRKYVKTLKTEGGNPAGTSQTAKQRFNKIFLRLVDSSIPLINGQKPPERAFNERLDTFRILLEENDGSYLLTEEGGYLLQEESPSYHMPIFMTGDIDITNLGWEDQGQIEIEQDLDLHVEVSAMFGRLAVKEV